MTDTTLRLTRVIRAPRDKVFKAWTTPEWLLKWWGPGPITCPSAEIDLRPGGQYRIGNTEQDGSITWISGRFTVVVEPEKLVYDWSVSILDAPPTEVTVLFSEHPEGTELTLTHTRFPNAEIRDMHARGWEGCLVKLDALMAI